MPFDLLLHRDNIEPQSVIFEVTTAEMQSQTAAMSVSGLETESQYTEMEVQNAEMDV